MMSEVREFVRDVGGPVVIAELIAIAFAMSAALFIAGLLVGDL